MTPQDFWDLPKEEQAVMIAFTQAKSKMLAWEDKQQRKDLE